MPRRRITNSTMYVSRAAAVCGRNSRRGRRRATRRRRRRRPASDADFGGAVINAVTAVLGVAVAISTVCNLAGYGFMQTEEGLYFGTIQQTRMRYQLDHEVAGERGCASDRTVLALCSRGSGRDFILVTTPVTCDRYARLLHTHCWCVVPSITGSAANALAPTRRPTPSTRPRRRARGAPNDVDDEVPVWPSLAKGEGNDTGAPAVSRGVGGPRSYLKVDDALDAVLDLLVELLQPLDVLLVRVPVAPAVRLEERRDHVAERVRVRLEEALLHGLVLDERVVRIFVDEVVDLAGRRAPAHGVAQALRDLARALVADASMPS